METGFEIIKCNFSEGLDFVSRKRRPDRAKDDSYNRMFLLERINEVTKRYHGIDGGRVTLDNSCMISAYFYPTYLSNPGLNPAVPSLPRLLFTDPEVISRIKSDLGHVLKVSLPDPSTNWQGVAVADMIVKRYSDRLKFMAGDLPTTRCIPFWDQHAIGLVY